MSKNICFVVYNYSEYGGVGYVASNLANAFSKNDTVFLLSLLNDDRPKAYPLNKEVRYSALIPAKKRLRNQIKALHAPVRNYFQKNRIDVAIILGHWPAFLISPVKPFVRTKYVFCDHGALMNQWDDKKNTFMRWLAAMTSDCTVALTKRTHDDYIQKFHLKKSKVCYIYNWIEIMPTDSNLYDVCSKRFLSAGRFSYEKGFDQLIEIVRPVFKKYPDWHLDLFGDGEMFDIVKQRIHDYHLSSNVHLMGKRNDLRDYYKQYAFYVLPSLREGLPMVLLEAKCNRLPIIGFDILTGPAEIIRDNTDGFLIRANDNNAFSEAICTLIENNTMRLQMADHSRDNLNLFDKNAILKQWKSLIDSL